MGEGIIALLGCLAFIVLYIAIGALAAWVIEVAWNAVIASMFHGPRIDYWTAYVLYAALSIIGGLFKSVAAAGAKS